MLINLSTSIPLITIIVYGVLIAFVNLHRPQTPQRRALNAYLATLFAWSLSAFVLLTGLGNALTWFRIMIVAGISSMMSIFHFAQVCLAKRRRWSIWLYLYGLVMAILTLFTDLVVVSAFVSAGTVHYQFSPLVFLVAGPGYGLVIFSLVELYRGSTLLDDPIQRNRLRYLRLGLIIMILASLVDWTPLGRYPIDIAGNSISALLITYVILRHQLIDISLVIRKGIFYSIPTIVIAAVYFLIMTLAFRIFQSTTTPGLFLLSMIVAVITALLTQSFREKAQTWIDRTFFREKYDATLMLQRISQSSASFLEVEMLGNMILEEIFNTLQVKKAAFFVKNKTTQEFLMIAQRNLEKNANLRLLPDHPVIQYMNVMEHAITRKEVEGMPHFKTLWREEKENLENIGELFIPLKAQGDLIGFLAIGQKRSDQPYSYDDQLTLMTLANQCAVAIENARLYTVEQARRKELDALYELSRQLIATDTMRTVLDSIVVHALDSIHTTFVRVILLKEDRSFYCPSAHPVRDLDFDLRMDCREPDSAYRYYRQALKSDQPIVLERSRVTLTENARRALFLDQVHSICLCPLRVGDQNIGLLMLGECRQANRESFDGDKLRLATSIADQAASGIQRALLHEQLEEGFMETIIALANTLEARDSYTGDHGERLSRLAERIARRMGCTPDEIQAIHWAMALHDIGKIGVPDEILRKPGPLNDEEWLLMKRHPDIGADIIAPVARMKNVEPIIRHHHERFDGNGYPQRLKGYQIPLGARILSVVDAYGAIIDHRVYRKARSHDEAVVEIKRCIGTQFDAQVAEVFLDVLDEYIREGNHINNSIEEEIPRIPSPGD
jgi:HD-GYP domain-containing protein (c-di-GMP phosphodiesterase class II)